MGRASLIVGRDLPSLAGDPLPWRRGAPVDLDDPPPDPEHGLPLVLPGAAATSPPLASGLFSRPALVRPPDDASVPTGSGPDPEPAPVERASARGPDRWGSASRWIAALVAVLVLLGWWRRHARR